MVLSIVVAVVAFGAGFGAGRVKNAAKLNAVRDELAKVEGKLTADFGAVVAKIKSLI